MMQDLHLLNRKPSFGVEELLVADKVPDKQQNKYYVLCL